jgi:hypothetical protein
MNPNKVLGTVLALAVAGVIVVAILKNDDPVPRSTCAIGLKSLKSLAAGYQAGDEVGILLGLAPAVCEELVRSAFNSPSAGVEATISLPTGEMTTFSGAGGDFFNLAPQPRQSPEFPDLERMIECNRSYYPLEFLYDDCVAGTIEPL